MLLTFLHNPLGGLDLMRGLSLLGAPIRTLLSLRYYVEALPITLLSEAEKREHIAFWSRITGIKTFVETGTYLGKTTLHMSRIFNHCYTIEYDQALFERAKNTFAGIPNITPMHGDSGILIDSILANLNEAAIFWLDAHYSSRNTGRATLDSPIIRELHAILNHRVKQHVILIDDARFFRGTHGYPTPKALRKMVGQTDYSIRFMNDIIRIYRDDI